MRLSNRDILLLIGIVVAVVITLTTVIYRDRLDTVKKEVAAPKKTSMAILVHKLVDLIGKHNNVKHSQ
ncbi:MAG TPA: hypothetical protein VF473_00665 [Cyclobacteriaceae bacterium]